MFANKILWSIAVIAGSASAYASVTVNTTTVGKASVIDVTGNGVSQIKRRQIPGADHRKVKMQKQPRLSSC